MSAVKANGLRNGRRIALREAHRGAAAVWVGESNHLRVVCCLSVAARVARSALACVLMASKRPWSAANANGLRIRV